ASGQKSVGSECALAPPKFKKHMKALDGFDLCGVLRTCWIPTYSHRLDIGVDIK
ncbi:hypothetical protein KI387_039177, partial [Taxus chinensis]